MQTRRETLQRGAAVAALLAAAGWLPQTAFAAINKAAFDAKSLAEAYKSLGIAAPVENKAVTMQAPDIAENGAVVPITVATTLKGVKQMLILVEKNPTALVANFHVSDSIDANFATRAKMGQTSDVYAVAVMNDGKVYYTKKEVKVTAGGCGG